MEKLQKELLIATAALSLAAPLASIAAPTGTVSASPLSMGKSAYQQKNYAKALQIYESAAKTDQYKNSCECRLGLGKSLCKIADTQSAEQKVQTQKRAAKELRAAIRLGRGSANSIEANKIMMSLPHSVIAPRMGADTPLIAMANGLRSMERGGAEAKPKVLEFYASWCDPCNKLKPIIDKARADYGEQVEFIRYNIDDPQTEKVIEDYEVSPIPTLIFLDSSNQVITYSVGYSGENGLKAGIKKILPQT